MMLVALLAAAAISHAQAEARLATLDRAARAQEARLAAEQAPLTRLLATAQRLALQPPAAALVQPDTIGRMIRTRAMIAALAPEIRRRTAGLRRQMVAAAAARAELEQALAATFDASPAPATAVARELTARFADLPMAPLRPVGSAHIYRLPARGTVLVGTGEQSAVGIRARGLTLATAAGAPVIAPATARVAYAGPFRGYGDIVILDHGHGWTTLLAGLELATVTGGEIVRTGMPIGHMTTAAPRLTIELRHDGRPVDVAAMALQ